jgi:hypothetical protein
VRGITWIASYPKSGNTWLRLFFTNLFLNSPEPASINDVDRFGFADGERRLYRKLSPQPLPLDIPFAQLVSLRERLQKALSRSRSDYVLCKTHWPFADNEGRRYIDPACTASAIYVVRDPRDVVLSFAHHQGFSPDRAIRALTSSATITGPSAEQVREYFGDWATHAAEWTSTTAIPVHVVRYEDLLADPHRRFEDIVEFIKFPAEPGRVQRAVEHARFEEASKQEREIGFNERSHRADRFFRRGDAGEWRHQLTEEQLHALESVCAPTMRQLGYTPATTA